MREAILTSGNTLADGAPFYSQPFFVSTSILNMVNLVQWTSMMLMPTMLKEIQSDFDLGPEALGGVMMARELILYALSPVFGYCADTYNRRIVLAMGILAWGLAMIIAGAAKQYAELLAAMLLMGSGMAATVPVSYSLLGDYYDSADLGKAFGWLGFSSVIGALCGVVLPTAVAEVDFGVNIRPWRFCTYMLGCVVLLTSIVVIGVVRNPQRKGDAQGISWATVRGFMRNRTYMLVLAQGFFASLAWDNMSFMMLWFECMGFNMYQAAIVFGVCCIGAAVGGLFGGYTGDWATARSKRYGRLVVAQCSVFLGIPFAYVYYGGHIPQDAEHLGMYAVVGFFFGFSVSWPASSCILPIIAEIVPPNALGTGYAVDRLVEGVATSWGSLLVGFVAKANGYKGGTVCDSTDKQVRHEQAGALGHAMTITMCVPWFICFLIFFVLYFTYYGDRVDLDENKDDAEAERRGLLMSSDDEAGPSRPYDDEAENVNLADDEVLG